MQLQLELEMADARVRHFMSADVACVADDASLAEATEQMRDARLSCVVVVEGRRPVGVITERDLTGLCSRLLAGETPGTVREVMSQGVLTLDADATCSDAVDTLRKHRIRRLVIVDEKQELAGIITQTDLLRAHTHEIELQKERLEERVAERTRELEQLNEKLRSLARIDPMLGIGNRRAMDDELEKMHQRARRYGRPYSVALMDVDYFKKFNDHYGHQAGDDTLLTVARVAKHSVRAADEVYRYGGEEFLVLLPEVTVEGAAIAAEHIRAAVEQEACEHQLSPLGVVTVSIGVANEDMDTPNLAQTIARADEALYRAKERGRNRVEACDGYAKGVQAA